MSSTTGNIVTVNTGSSSIKLAIFAASPAVVDTSSSLTISVSNIGRPVATLTITKSNELPHTQRVEATNHLSASLIVMSHLADVVSADSIMAIGHRLVHGGTKYTDPTVIKHIADADWVLLTQLDPLHTPAARQLIDQFARQYPSAMQIACFDTAFFRDLPRIAKIIPIPQKYYGEGVRRYGFHGISYTSLLATFHEKAGDSALHGRIILAHLGSGASLTAVHNGKPIDTTMGFTPTSGIAMSTRSGDLDPTIFRFLHAQNHMGLDEFTHMVSSQSGLLGVSQLTGDMRSLLDVEHENDDAALAVGMFVRDVRKSVGALAASLGGVDSLIFSGAIGENSAILRTRMCQGLAYMDVQLDDNANAASAFLISSKQSRVGVHVIASDEARIIAQQTQGLLIKESRK